MNNEITLLNQDKTTHRVIDLDTMSTEGAKNKIINGRFRIDQEGNMGVQVPNSIAVYAADQMPIYCNATGGLFTPTQVNGSGMKVTVDSVPTDFSGLLNMRPMKHDLEANNIFHLNNKTLTLSFKFASNVNGTYSIAFRNQADTRSYVTDFVYNGNGAEVVIEKQITLESSTISTNDNSLGMWLMIGAYNAGTVSTSILDAWADQKTLCSTSATNWTSTIGNWVYLNDVQLEEGSVATAYEHIDYGDELARCMRYYETGDHRLRLSPTATALGATQSFTVIKRAAPSISTANLSGTVSTSNASVSRIFIEYNSFLSGNGNASFIADARL